MKILKAEVRTSYVIEYSKRDLMDIIANAPKDRKNYLGVFEKCGGENVTMVVVSRYYEGIIDLTPDQLTYIANKLGFDGWENAGYYNRDRKVRNMVVYREGDTLNG
jgi:hypothetical protein|nr:MAG TPA: translational regulation protein [Caudoviricetes sp.]